MKYGHTTTTGLGSIAIAICLILLTAAPSTAFTTFRCRSKVVTLGDRSVEVEYKCGEPASRNVVAEVKTRARTFGLDASRKELVEEWVYDNRYGWFDILTFRGGRLVRIDAVKK